MTTIHIEVKEEKVPPAESPGTSALLSHCIIPVSVITGPTGTEMQTESH